MTTLSGKKPRAYVGSLTVHCGPATIRGRLMPVQISQEALNKEALGGESKFCTPDGKPVHQRYVDDAGNLYEPSQLSKAIVDENGVYTLIDPSALTEAKKSDLPANIMNMQVHSRKETESLIFPSSHTAYILQPVIKSGKNYISDPTNDSWYDFLLEIVESGKYTILARANIHGHEGLYALVSYKGYLTVQRMTYPEGLWQEYGPHRSGISKTHKAKAKAVADALTVGFDLGDYVDARRERMAVAAETGFDPQAVAAAKPKAESINIDDALEAFLNS